MGISTKWQVLMRIQLITTVVLAGFLHLGAAVHSQTVTFSGQRQSLETVIEAIKQQTGYLVVSTRSALKKAAPVTVNATAMPLEQFLQTVLAGQPLTYEVAEKSIMLKEAPRRGGRDAINRVSTVDNTLILAYPTVTGRIVDSTGSALVGASVRVLNADGQRTSLQTKTDQDGYFTLQNVPEDAILEISYIGYVTYTVQAAANLGSIVLREALSDLEEVEVTINTGYQRLSKERATGSFDYLGNVDLERQVGPYLMDRLDGNANAVLFDKRGLSSQITVRGRSTIHAGNQPLIVLDNFPYEGDITNINPADIESVTILKDAAAASIWGARAGNGVIVITTKKGAVNKPMHIGFNSNMTVGAKPDMFYQPAISSADFIDLEIDLFDKGFYTGLETSYDNIALSPVIELLIQEREGQISSEAVQNMIGEYRKHDVRTDYERYLYVNSTQQQHIANISGGSDRVAYYFLAGYDKNRGNLDEKYSRINLRTDNTFYLTKNIALNLGLFYTQTASSEGRPSYNNLRFTSSQPLYPYARLADEDGNALSIPKNYRDSFIKSAESKGLLDWSYTPLRDMELINNNYGNRDFLFNSGLHLKIVKGLNADIKYQYQDIVSDGRNLQNQWLYSVRDMINNYTQVDPESGSVTRPIPLGDVLTISNTTAHTHAFRAQLNYNYAHDKNEFDAIAGAEYRSTDRESSSSGVYGFNNDILVHTPVNHEEVYTRYSNPYISSRIGDMRTFDGTISRMRSFYTNMAYTFDRKYVLSASARQDGSNIFGVNANQRVVPLWSVGGAWNVSNERFYHANNLPFLRIRLTYGYNGNVDQGLSAFTTMSHYTTNLNNQPYGMIMNPPNPELRWERVQLLNAGIDFGTANNRISGALEYYWKNSSDLIGDMPIDQTTGAISGQLTFVNRGNSANMKGEGIDLIIHAKNIEGQFNWNSTFLFNYNRNWVTAYSREPTTVNQYVNGGIAIIPVIGKPLYSIFTYDWAGLDAETGDPLGYFEGEISKQYSDILNKSKIEDLVYHGPALPPFFGSIRNTVSWKGLSLSANITYRFGYYFKRSSLRYDLLYNTWVGHTDYGKRWKQPGDESSTSVPSAIYPANTNRDSFYSQSGILIEKGDNIRLQDINLSYRLADNGTNIFLFKNITVYGYMNNVGILWRANRHGIDPDFGTSLPIPKTYSLGIKAEL